MDAYSLHLAMAALAGASVAAISAYYAHQKALAQLLDFALATEIGRHRGGARRRPRKGRRSGDRRRSGSGVPSDAAEGGAAGDGVGGAHGRGRAARAVFDAVAGGGTYDSGEISSDFSPH